MKIVAKVYLVLLSVMIGCNQREEHEDIFKGVPIANTILFIDSIEHKIRLDAGQNFTGYPTPKKNEYYYDERNFHDSLGDFLEYSIIECLGDTIHIHTNYYYYKNQLISVDKHVIGIDQGWTARYFFKNNKLIFKRTTGKTETSIPVDTLLNRGKRYLLIKGNVGDTAFKKYFGKEVGPPNSTLELVE
jgi:hypothetical protein